MTPEINFKKREATSTSDYGEFASDIIDGGQFKLGFDRENDTPILIPYGIETIWTFDINVIRNLLSERDSLELNGQQYDALNKISEVYDKALGIYQDFKAGNTNTKDRNEEENKPNWRVTINIEGSDGDYNTKSFRLDKVQEMLGSLPLDDFPIASGTKIIIELEYLN